MHVFFILSQMYHVMWDLHQVGIFLDSVLPCFCLDLALIWSRIHSGLDIVMVKVVLTASLVSDVKCLHGFMAVSL